MLPILHNQLQSTHNLLQLLSNQISSEIKTDAINSAQSINDLSNLYKLSTIVSGNKRYALDTLSKIISVLKTSKYYSNNIITINSIELKELFEPYQLSPITVIRIISTNKIPYINHRETKNNKNVKHNYTIFI